MSGRGVRSAFPVSIGWGGISCLRRSAAGLAWCPIRSDFMCGIRVAGHGCALHMRMLQMALVPAGTNRYCPTRTCPSDVRSDCRSCRVDLGLHMRETPEASACFGRLLVWCLAFCRRVAYGISTLAVHIDDVRLVLTNPRSPSSGRAVVRSLAIRREPG